MAAWAVGMHSQPASPPTPPQATLLSRAWTGDRVMMGGEGCVCEGLYCHVSRPNRALSGPQFPLWHSEWTRDCVHRKAL